MESEKLLRTNGELEFEVGQLELDVAEAKNGKSDLVEEVSGLQLELDIYKENARLWQKLAECKIEQLSLKTSNANVETGCWLRCESG